MATDPALWRPTVQDVANVLPARVDGTTFTAETKPTATEVAGLIRQVQSEVTLRVGDVPLSLTTVPAGGTIGESPAGHVVAVGAAAYVELDFFPDLSLTGESPAARLWEQYQRLLDALAGAVESANSGTDPGDSPEPSWAFPDAVSYGVGTTPWETF